VQRLIGADALQPAILVLERPHLGDVADFHPAELGLPLVKRRLADAVPPADVFSRLAGLLLLRMPTIWASVNRDFLTGGLP
jgi:hypothetical protein